MFSIMLEGKASVSAPKRWIFRAVRHLEHVIVKQLQLHIQHLEHNNLE